MKNCDVAVIIVGDWEEDFAVGSIIPRMTEGKKFVYSLNRYGGSHATLILVSDKKLDDEELATICNYAISEDEDEGIKRVECFMLNDTKFNIIYEEEGEK